MNLRDVGGYLTRRGEALASGRLFRSAQLPLDVDAAAGLVAATGIRRVIDLRMEKEVDEAGTPALPDSCEWIRLPLFASLQPDWPDPVDRTPPSTAQRYFAMAQAGRSAMARVVELLGDAASQPTLIHCAAGRDRTGIVIACLLDLLGVPDETIGADYALSSVVDDGDGRNAHPDNILILLQMIRSHFGSVEAMLLGAGSSGSSIHKLHTALVAQPG